MKEPQEIMNDGNPVEVEPVPVTLDELLTGLDQTMEMDDQTMEKDNQASCFWKKNEILRKIG